MVASQGKSVATCSTRVMYRDGLAYEGRDEDLCVVGWGTSSKHGRWCTCHGASCAARPATCVVSRGVLGVLWRGVSLQCQPCQVVIVACAGNTWYFYTGLNEASSGGGDGTYERSYACNKGLCYLQLSDSGLSEHDFASEDCDPKRSRIVSGGAERVHGHHRFESRTQCQGSERQGCRLSRGFEGHQ